MKIQNLSDDYKDFLNEEPSTPPSSLSTLIHDQIHRDLHPSPYLVFSKLLGIQAFIGTLTMFFCPQFNLSLTHNYDLFHFLHHTFGENICMSICGSLFIGTGAFFASFLMNSSEIQLIKKSLYLSYLSISLLTILVFLFIGAEVYLKLTAFWYLGACLSGISVFKLKDIFNNLLFKNV